MAGEILEIRIDAAVPRGAGFWWLDRKTLLVHPELREAARCAAATAPARVRLVELVDLDSAVTQGSGVGQAQAAVAARDGKEGDGRALTVKEAKRKKGRRGSGRRS